MWLNTLTIGCPVAYIHYISLCHLHFTSRNDDYVAIDVWVVWFMNLCACTQQATHVDPRLHGKLSTSNDFIKSTNSRTISIKWLICPPSTRVSKKNKKSLSSIELQMLLSKNITLQVLTILLYEYCAQYTIARLMPLKYYDFVLGVPWNQRIIYSFISTLQ